MFPSKAQPFHAVFVKNRLARVAKLCDLKVIAPIAYFPFSGFIKKYAERKNIPKYDIIEGMEIFYPRFLSIPKFFKPLDGIFLFLSCYFFIKKNLKNFSFDLIDAHLAFPDGYEAILLKKCFNKPVTITLRGHDINDLPQYPVRFRQVKYALKNADRVFSVAKALQNEAISFGIDKTKFFVRSNGVDSTLFKPQDKIPLRKKLNLPLDKKIIVSVGHLVKRKGFHIIIQAVKKIVDKKTKDVFLVIVGGAGEEGDFSNKLKNLIAELRLEKYVYMAGAQLNNVLPEWYAAADISCLASSKEGWANVLLESLACGVPVVGTNVWGTPEVICSEDYGILTQRCPDKLAADLFTALNKKWDKQKIIDYAKKHSWDKLSEKLYNDFNELISIDTK